MAAKPNNHGVRPTVSKNDTLWKHGFGSVTWDVTFLDETGFVTVGRYQYVFSCSQRSVSSGAKRRDFSRSMSSIRFADMSSGKPAALSVRLTVMSYSYLSASIGLSPAARRAG